MVIVLQSGFDESEKYSLFHKNTWTDIDRGEKAHNGAKKWEQPEICALLRCKSMGNLWIATPCANDQRPSVGEVMRSIESRMRESRTSGLTSRRSETNYGSLQESA